MIKDYPGTWHRIRKKRKKQYNLTNETENDDVYSITDDKSTLTDDDFRTLNSVTGNAHLEAPNSRQNVHKKEETYGTFKPRKQPTLLLFLIILPTSNSTTEVFSHDKQTVTMTNENNLITTSSTSLEDHFIPMQSLELPSSSVDTDDSMGSINSHFTPTHKSAETGEAEFSQNNYETDDSIGNINPQIDFKRHSASAEGGKPPDQNTKFRDDTQVTFVSDNEDITTTDYLQTTIEDSNTVVDNYEKHNDINMNPIITTTEKEGKRRKILEGNSFEVDEDQEAVRELSTTSSTQCICPTETTQGKATTKGRGTTPGYVTKSGECICPSLSTLGDEVETATAMPWLPTSSRARARRQGKEDSQAGSWDTKLIKNIPFLRFY